MEQRILKAACYCRLSEDDLNDGTSISIETQITIAKQYCKTNRIEIVDLMVIPVQILSGLRLKE